MSLLWLITLSGIKQPTKVPHTKIGTVPPDRDTVLRDGGKIAAWLQTSNSNQGQNAVKITADKFLGDYIIISRDLFAHDAVMRYFRNQLIVKAGLIS